MFAHREFATVDSSLYLRPFPPWTSVRRSLRKRRAFSEVFRPRGSPPPPAISFPFCVRLLIGPHGGRYFPHLSRSHGSNSVRVPIYGGLATTCQSQSNSIAPAARRPTRSCALKLLRPTISNCYASVA